MYLKYWIVQTLWKDSKHLRVFHFREQNRSPHLRSCLSHHPPEAMITRGPLTRECSRWITDMKKWRSSLAKTQGHTVRSLRYNWLPFVWSMAKFSWWHIIVAEFCHIVYMYLGKFLPGWGVRILRHVDEWLYVHMVTHTHDYVFSCQNNIYLVIQAFVIDLFCKYLSKTSHIYSQNHCCMIYITQSCLKKLCEYL